MRFRCLFFFLIIVLLVNSGCGYRFSGGGSLPGKIRNVRVAILDNRTTETGLENLVTNDLIYEFTRSGKARVTDSDNADATLSGTIRYLRIASVAHSSSSTAVERRVTVGVDLKLADTAGTVIWSIKDFSANETYDVASSKLDTEQNKQQALIQLSKRLAERVYNRMTEDF